MSTRYQFVDDSGETRLAGTLVPDPGVLLGPYSLAFDDAGVVNPVNGYGVLVGPTLPAGAVLLAAWGVVTTTWVAAEGFDEFDINLVVLSDSSVVLVGGQASSTAPAAETPIAFVNNGAAAAVPYLLRGATRLAYAAWPTASLPSAGATDVYALVALAT